VANASVPFIEEKVAKKRAPCKRGAPTSVYNPRDYFKNYASEDNFDNFDYFESDEFNNVKSHRKEVEPCNSCPRK